MPGSKVPKERSKETHELLQNTGEVVFVSFDSSEAAVEQAVIVQISAEVVFRLDLVRNKSTRGKYKGEIHSATDTYGNKSPPRRRGIFDKPSRRGEDQATPKAPVNHQRRRQMLCRHLSKRGFICK